MFITFEGGEGSGKSTAIKRIKEALEEMGYEVLLTREPGGTPIAEQIRDVILARGNTALDPMAEALLYAASRRQHIVEKILPALEEGKVVLSDRFLDSSLAYQGGARGLGIERVYGLNQFATDGLLPDLTIFFDLAPEIGIERISKNSAREVNRLDVESESFHEKVRLAFKKLIAMFPERIKTVDASKSPEQVFKDSFALIKEALEK